MEYRNLGSTGVKVSPLCLGAMMFGEWGNPDHEDSIRIIHRALDAGINFIDTADVYSRGESEEIVGKALQGGRRENVVLATKFHGAMGDDPNQAGNSRRWIMREVEASLRTPFRKRFRETVGESITRKPEKGVRNGFTVGPRRALGGGGAADPEGEAPLPLPRSQACARSSDPDRHPLCLEDRHPLGGPPPGDGLRLGGHLLATPARMAGTRCVAE